MTGYVWSVSSGGTIVSGTGTYSVNILWTATGNQTVGVYYTDQNGCTAPSVSTKNVTVHPLPFPSITGATVLCAASSGITYTTEAGMTSYTWMISPGGIITTGSGTNTITVTWNSPGSQTVRVNYTNPNGCRASVPSELTVVVLPLPVPTISGLDSVCAGSTGIGYLTEAGMSGYVWSVSSGGTITSGMGTPAITVTWNTAGNRTVSVSYTNVTGCSAAAPTSKNIKVHALPVPTINGSDSLCVGSTGIIYTTETGMTNYTWNISPGGTITAGQGTPAITVSWNISGNQTVSVNYVNSKGCTATSTTVKNIRILPLPLPSITGNDSICTGTSGITYTTEPGMTGYSWSILSGGIITSGQGTSTITVTWNNPGNHIISVNYTSSKGCVPLTPTLKTIRVFSLPTPTITGSDSLCAGSTGILYSTQSGMTGYSWTVSSGGSITAGIGTNQITVTWNTPGTQSVTVNYANNKGCFAQTPVLKIVKVHPLPVPSIAGSDSICAGTSGVIYTTEPGMNAYSWSISSGGVITGGTGTNSITVTWNLPGLQSVNVQYTNSKGCTSLIPTIKSVRVLSLPVPSIIGQEVICAGSTGVTYFTESGMTGYTWSVSSGGIITGGAGTNTILVTWITPGNQSVFVNYTDIKGCQALSPSQKIVNVLARPTPTITGLDSICAASSGILYSTEPGMTGYIWTTSAGGTITSGTGTHIITVTWNNPGNQWVSVNYTGSNGCSAVNPTIKNVKVHPLPVPSIAGSDSLCAGSSGVSYLTESGMQGYTWSISPGGVITSGAGTHNITVTWNVAGIQWIGVTYTNLKGCSASSPSIKQVHVHPLPVPAISGPDSLCEGSTGISYTTESGMSGYVWSVSSGGIISSGQGTAAISINWITAGTQIVSVLYINSKGCTPATPTVKNIMVHPRPQPVITGATSVCSGTSNVVYSTSPGMSNYQWTISSGGVITSGQGTDTVLVTWNTPGNQTISVSYTTPKGCTPVTPGLLAVIVHSLPVPTITGAGAVCKGTSGIIYATENGMSGYIWTISPEGAITSGLGTSTITVSWNTSGNGTVEVNYTNNNGCTAMIPTIKNVIVYPLPVPTITGPAAICNNANATYTTESGMTGYQWTVSSGGIITSGSSTQTIQVQWTSPGAQTVSVNYTNSNGCTASAPTSYSVIVHNLPSPTITGNTSVCAGATGELYSTESGMTNYQWTVTAGGSIVAGQGNDTVTINWNTTGIQVVSVTYTNAGGCNPPSPTNYTVTVNPIPVPTISGSSQVCQSATITYSTQTGQSNYQWYTSSGGIISSGQGTSTVQVIWNDYGSQWISVTYTSTAGCPAASPDTLLVWVDPLPAIPGPISGPDEICAPEDWIEYSVAPVQFAINYAWSFPPGVIITAGGNTNVVHVTFIPGAQSGNINVHATNSCGNGPNGLPLWVTVSQTPPKPVISLFNADSLVSSAMYGNQWYRNGNVLPGDTFNYLMVQHTGTYHTVVTEGKCVSEPSNQIYVIVVGLQETAGAGIRIFPNPADLFIRIIANQPIEELTIVNPMGMIVKKKSLPDREALLDISDLNRGFYFVRIKTSGMFTVRKILIR
jgi:hypothetical protein